MAKALVDRRWRTLLLAVPFLLYCALPTRNYYWDGLAFAIDIEKHPLSSTLLYPSHLIYESFGGWLYRLSALAGFHTRALFLMQGANCILAGLSVLLLDKCLRLRNVSSDDAVAWTLVFGFSATWWRFASDANAYVPAIFLLLCADALLESRPMRVLAAGALTACAMLFHELAVLFLVVALIRLFPKSKAQLLLFLAVSSIPVALAYAIAYRSGPGGAPESSFFAWVTWHSPDSHFSFDPLDDLLLSLRGTLRLFFGGRFAEFAGDGISKASAALLVAAALGFVVNTWKAARGGLRVMAPNRHLLAWIGIYVLFLFFWMPQNTFYRLFYLAPLVLLLATALQPGRTIVWMFTAVLALWNFTFLAYPQSRPEANAPLHFALARQKDWNPGTPIVYRTFHPDLWTISYFNQQASWIGLEHSDTNRLDQLLAAALAAGHPLWLEETAYLPVAADPAGRHWIELHERRDERIEFKDDRHDFRFHCFR